MTKIIITIKNGEIQSKVEGISGIKCTEVDKFLKQLGSVVKNDKTKEYYQEDNVEVINRVNLQG